VISKLHVTWTMGNIHDGTSCATDSQWNNSHFCRVSLWYTIYNLNTYIIVTSVNYSMDVNKIFFCCWTNHRSHWLQQYHVAVYAGSWNGMTRHVTWTVLAASKYYVKWNFDRWQMAQRMNSASYRQHLSWLDGYFNSNIKNRIFWFMKAYMTSLISWVL